MRIKVIHVFLNKPEGEDVWYVSSPDMENLMTYYNTLDEAISDIPHLVKDLLEADEESQNPFINYNLPMHQYDQCQA